MRFISHVTLLFFLVPIFTNSQESKDRLYLSMGFITTKDKIEEPDFDDSNIISKNSFNFSGGFSYEHQFTSVSGIEVFIGYKNLRRFYYSELDSEKINFLSENNLSWNEPINIPIDQHYFSTRIGYVYQYHFNEKAMFSFISGLHYRFAFNDETVVSEHMFYKDNEDFLNNIGPRAYISQTSYNQHVFNPYINLKYERKTKYNNTYGASLYFNIPFIKSYDGIMTVLPEFEAYKSQFNYYSRGEFWGVSFFYGTSLNNR